jgi:hypothetical protein
MNTNDTTPETPTGWWNCQAHGKTEGQCKCGASTAFIAPTETPPAMPYPEEPEGFQEAMLRACAETPPAVQDEHRYFRMLNEAVAENKTLASQLAQAREEAKKFRDMYLAEWQENESALENAGVKCTPDEHGGKPVIAGIVELRDARDRALAELSAAREECERQTKRIMDVLLDRENISAERDQLRAEKAELERDKARLDWMLDEHPTELTREAIDAALTKHQTVKQE